MDQHIAAERPRRVVVHAARAVRDIAEHHRLGVREPLDQIRQRARPHAQPLGQLQRDARNRRLADLLDRLGHLETVVGRQQRGHGGLELGIVRSLGRRSRSRRFARGARSRARRAADEALSRSRRGVGHGVDCQRRRLRREPSDRERKSEVKLKIAVYTALQALGWCGASRRRQPRPRPRPDLARSACAPRLAHEPACGLVSAGPISTSSSTMPSPLQS